MIQIAQAMPCGNAAALLIRPVPGASGWRLLRRTDDEFTDEDDGLVVESGDDDDAGTVVDTDNLINGTTYYYLCFCRFEDTWAASGGFHTVVPHYEDQPDFHSPDPAAFVRLRLDLGLAGELALGRISHSKGRVPVLSAPPQIDQVPLPLVTVMLESRGSEVRAVGEEIIPDIFDAGDDLWSEHEGWLDRSRLQIIVWSLNPDERKALRDAVQRVLMLNLPLFDHANFTQIDLNESEQADFQSFNAPVYQAVFDFSCLHPSIVRGRVLPIRHTEVVADAYTNQRTLHYQLP
jgi:hypothetical protein